MIFIAKEGLPIILTVAIVTVAVSLFAQRLGLVCLVILLFVLFFFRDPVRHTPTDDADGIYSPADGTVMEIKQAEINGQKYKQIVIFLSVFNVHVNRVPYAGIVQEVKYFPGNYFAAYRKDVDTKNERMQTDIDTNKGLIRVVQITGAIARRIVCHLKPADKVATGQKFGLIRFGSRTDCYVPEWAEVLVKPKDKVQGGLTKIARFTK